MSIARVQMDGRPVDDRLEDAVHLPLSGKHAYIHAYALIARDVTLREAPGCHAKSAIFP
jgi:hypothetical protein